MVPELFQDKFTAESVSKMTMQLMDEVLDCSRGSADNYELLRKLASRRRQIAWLTRVGRVLAERGAKF